MSLRNHPPRSRFSQRLRAARLRQAVITLGFWHVAVPAGAHAHHAHYIDGDVYFARGPSGLIKIGCSVTPEKRARKQKAVLLAVVPAGGRLEVFLHHYFEGFRVEGEWFRPEPPLIAFIDRVNQVFPLEEAAA